MRFNRLIILIILGLHSCGNPETITSETAQCVTPPVKTVDMASGSFVMGSDEAYREERPARSQSVEAFNIDITEVTNVQFAAFVEATNYVTDAERIQPGFDQAGGAVFSVPNAAQPSWWRFVEGANWQNPEGPGSSIKGRDNEPVVQISLNDAKAYAAWMGRRLPTEAEWEYAAAADQGPDGANTWQGAFPIENTKQDGYDFRAPVGCYAPNQSGLYDMIGNVWEWTDTIYQDANGEPVHAIKGGSFLCAPNYCRRYRASARQPQETGLSTNHIGFRTVSNQ